MEPTQPPTTQDPTPREPPTTPPSMIRRGELADEAASLLSHGFTSVRLTLKSFTMAPLQAGYAGYQELDPIFDIVEAIGQKATRFELDQKEGIDVRLENGNRLLYRSQLDPGGCEIVFVGEETEGPHRKSTPRNIRRLLRRILKSTARSAT